MIPRQDLGTVSSHSDCVERLRCRKMLADVSQSRKTVSADWQITTSTDGLTPEGWIRGIRANFRMDFAIQNAISLRVIREQRDWYAKTGTPTTSRTFFLFCYISFPSPIAIRHVRNLISPFSSWGIGVFLKRTRFILRMMRNCI